MKPNLPSNIAELLARANNLAGQQLGALANHYQISCPTDLKRQKGWVGQLIEHALGAPGNNAAEADFVSLGVELKTLPLNHHYLAKESTFICTANPPFGNDFTDSLVWKKCQSILWIPIEAESSIPLAARQIGHPILWQPDTAQTEILRQDWQELTEMLTLGRYAELTAKQGTYLQCRPKAANAAVIRQHINADSEVAKMIPRGFYLRPTLTNEILKNI